MTPNEQSIRDFIDRHIKKHGYEPTKMDIHLETSISRSEIDNVFQRLINSGVIKKLKVKRGQYIVV